MPIFAAALDQFPVILGGLSSRGVRTPVVASGQRDKSCCAIPRRSHIVSLPGNVPVVFQSAPIFKSAARRKWPELEIRDKVPDTCGWNVDPGDALVKVRKFRSWTSLAGFCKNGDGRNKLNLSDSIRFSGPSLVIKSFAKLYVCRRFG